MHAKLWPIRFIRASLHQFHSKVPSAIVEYGGVHTNQSIVCRLHNTYGRHTKCKSHKNDANRTNFNDGNKTILKPYCNDGMLANALKSFMDINKKIAHFTRSKSSIAAHVFLALSLLLFSSMCHFNAKCFMRRYLIWQSYSHLFFRHCKKL